MTLLAASSMADWPIIKQIAYLLGFLMRGIFLLFGHFGIYNIALCIIIFTIVTRLILYPLTVRQQRFSKLNSVMAPEIQAIQKKYEGKRDQVSMQRMQMEQRLVYDKYGVSMSAGCWPSLIQLIILFALYPVVYDLERYIPELANFSADQLKAMYTFCGIYLKDRPTLGLHASVLIPILAGVLQFISTQLMMSAQGNTSTGNSTADSMQSSMKTMNYVMPVMSVVFCFTFPAFIGVYWIVMSAVMIVQQLFINRHLKNLDVNEMIRKNVEKKNKKRARQGLPPINDKANINAKKLKYDMQTQPKSSLAEKSQVNTEARDAKIKESTEYYNSKTVKPGSLAAKANMVKEYNEKHEKNKRK